MYSTTVLLSVCDSMNLSTAAEALVARQECIEFCWCLLESGSWACVLGPPGSPATLPFPAGPNHPMPPICP